MDGLEGHCDGGKREGGVEDDFFKVMPDLGLFFLNSASQNSRVSIISPWAVTL